MSYTPVTFAYSEVITSAKLNQLAENDRVHAEALSDLIAFPHARFRHTAGSGIGSGLGEAGWTSIPYNTTPADGGVSRQPWTVSGAAITLTEAGLYLVTAMTSVQTGKFTARIKNTAPEPDVTLAQTSTGTDPSATQPLTFARQLPAGTTLVWQVKIEVTASAMYGDSPTTPCYVDIIRLSD